MRLGQYMGHLKYAFPPEFYTILKDLNQNPNYQIEDYKYLKRHIEANLGKKTREMFESLNTSPIKSDLFYQVTISSKHSGLQRRTGWELPRRDHESHPPIRWILSQVWLLVPEQSPGLCQWLQAEKLRRLPPSIPRPPLLQPQKLHLQSIFLPLIIVTRPLIPTTNLPLTQIKTRHHHQLTKIQSHPRPPASRLHSAHLLPIHQKAAHDSRIRWGLPFVQCWCPL